MPLEFGPAPAGTADPPPCTLKKTNTPPTGTPSCATAFTTIGFASAWPVAPAWPPPETSTTADTGKVTRTMTVSCGFVAPSACTTTFVMPRLLSACTTPVLPSTSTIVVSSDPQLKNALGSAAPVASYACAESANEFRPFVNAMSATARGDATTRVAFDPGPTYTGLNATATAPAALMSPVENCVDPTYVVSRETLIALSTTRYVKPDPCSGNPTLKTPTVSDLSPPLPELLC